MRTFKKAYFGLSVKLAQREISYFCAFDNIFWFLFGLNFAEKNLYFKNKY